MDLKYLAISNIGPFKGLHQFHFNTTSGKNGFAIFSKNGRGKTSLFNAMQWALFGEVFERGSVRSGRWSDGRKRTIVGDYSKNPGPMMNQDAYREMRIPEMNVIIIATQNGKDVQINRVARSRVGSMPRVDDDLNQNLTVTIGEEVAQDAKGQELVENLFPNELRRFFFIDGESLEEYVDLVKAGQVGGIKDDVESVLRLPALTRGISDLENIRSSIEKEIASESREKRIMEKSASEAQSLQIEINELKSNLETKERNFEKTKSRYNDLEAELKGFSEAISHIKELERLRAQKEALSTALKRSSDARYNLSSNAWMVLIWKRADALYGEVSEQQNNIQSSNYQIDLINRKIDKLKDEIEQSTGFCSHCEQPIVDAEDHKSRLKRELLDLESQQSTISSDSGLSMNEVITRMGDLAKLNPPTGSKKTIIESNENWLEDRRKLLNIIETLEKEESRGLEGVDSSELGAKHEQLGQMRTTLRRMEPVIDEFKQNIKRKETEFKRLGGGKISMLNHKKNNTNSTIGELLNVMKDTLAKYRDSARKDVERVASESFRNVINAPEALTGIKIDQNFNGSIVGADGRKVTMPSSGQEMTMTLCIMDALRRVSNVSAPIFFDTPGRSLDDDHKKAQLEYFWSMRNHQFIIFPHSGEYKIEETINEFGGLIGSAWELTWPADREVCEKCGEDSPLKEGSVMRCLKCEEKWDISIRETTVKVLEVES
jgi:DNA sulfur modification protein DndD